MYFRGNFNDEGDSSRDRRRQDRASPGSRHGSSARRSSSTRQTNDETSSPHAALEEQLDSLSFYELLKVDSNATIEEVRRAYRQEALVWHPDKNPHRKEEAEIRFKKIAEAYSVLSDPVKRRDYDNPATHDTIHGHFSSSDAFNLFGMFFGGRDPFSSMMSSFGHDDFFGHDLFAGHMGGRNFGERRRRPRRDMFQDFLDEDDFDHDFLFPMYTTSEVSSRSRERFISEGRGNRPSSSSTSITITFGGGVTEGPNGFQQSSTTTTTKIINGQRTVITTTSLTDAQGNTRVFRETPHQQLVNENPRPRPNRDTISPRGRRSLDHPSKSLNPRSSRRFE